LPQSLSAFGATIGTRSSRSERRNTCRDPWWMRPRGAPAALEHPIIFDVAVTTSRWGRKRPAALAPAPQSIFPRRCDAKNRYGCGA
jgi:hypothetical protein